MNEVADSCASRRLWDQSSAFWSYAQEDNETYRGTVAKFETEDEG